MTYNNWDIVTVPFPFTDKNTNKKRPALVINKPEYQCKTGHVILLMITSSGNNVWYSDVTVTDMEATGLKTPSVVRFKMFSLDERLIIKKIGYLSKSDKIKVKEHISNTFEL